MNKTDSPGEHGARQPRLFDLDETETAAEPANAELPWDAAATNEVPPMAAQIPAVLEPARRAFGWGTLLIGTALSLVAMVLMLQIWTFVAGLFQRSDWIGWTALTLAVLLLLSALMLILGEIVGFIRLGRLKGLRGRAERLLAPEAIGAAGDAKGLARQLAGLYADRTDLAWTLTSYRAHDTDIMAPPERLALFDRTVLAAVDDQVRQVITQSARRVAVVTALTPFVAVDMAFVLYENLRMLRRVATLYGGRPGLFGLLQLAGSVLGHMIAAGGLALSDDLLGQFIGQSFVKRLSARAGEGLFNAALTARIGIAATDLCRPLPFITAPPLRLRDLAAGVLQFWSR